MMYASITILVIQVSTVQSFQKELPVIPVITSYFVCKLCSISQTFAKPICFWLMPRCFKLLQLGSRKGLQN